MRVCAPCVASRLGENSGMLPDFAHNPVFIARGLRELHMEFDA